MPSIKEIIFQDEDVDSKTVVGVSENEIAELCVNFEYPLPERYLEFLRVAGKKLGNVGLDFDLFYPDIKYLRAELLEMIDEENLDFVLPNEAFVISAYQGFSYHYIICNGASDSKIYHITDGGPPEKCIQTSIGNYVRMLME